MASLFLSHLWAHSYERQECQLPPTDMVIIFKLVCFEIMTSFVCLIPSNNYSLSMSCALTGLFPHALQACVHACMCAHTSTCMCDMCEHLHPVLKARREPTAKPLMFRPSRLKGNFIVNGAQKCTCLQAIQRFGISRCIARPCMPLVICFVCACFGYVKRSAVSFNHLGWAVFTLGFAALFNLFFIFQ